MQLELFKQFYQSRNLPDADYRFGEQVLADASALLFPDGDLDEINVETIDVILDSFKHQNRLDVKVFIALMRYFRLIKRHDLFIRLTQYTGGIGVVENILKRAKERLGDEVDVLGDLTIPPLGTNPKDLSGFTSAFMKRLFKLTDALTIQLILAGNNHGIPIQAFDQEKKFYQESISFQEYLKHLHERKVLELIDHYAKQTVWFEQEVTKEMIDFVKNNQEILSGVLEGDLLYQTKIPYDTNRYLQAKTKTEQAYYACHCPFAREAIKKNDYSISPLWCYCSAGFEKVLFEVIFNQPLPITCVNSVLKGDEFCRFAIDLSQVDYKK